MKNLLIAILSFFSVCSFGQGLKIGYIDEAYVTEKLPDAIKVNQIVKDKKDKYDAILNQKYNDYQKKLGEYQKISTDKQNVVLIKDKEKELQDLSVSIETLRNNAEQDLYKTYQDLVVPIREKIKKASNELAVEKGYNFVLRKNVDYGAGENRSIILYSDDANNDLSNDLIVKLGGILQNKNNVPSTKVPK